MSHLGTKILYTSSTRPPTSPASARSRRGSTWRPSCARATCRSLSLETRVAAARLRRGRLLAAVRADLHERPQHARPRRASRCARADRGDDAPLVIAGGPTATHPEPLAPFIDAFFIGEGEEQLPALLPARRRRCGARGCRARAPDPAGRELPRSTCPRSTTTDRRRRHRLPGRRRARWIRACRPAPQRAWVADINRVSVPRRLAAAVRRGDLRSHGVEIARGCTEGCRFCQAGMIYRPVRERDPDAVVDAARRRREEGRLRRDLAHLAVDRRLLVHHAAGEGGDGQAARRSRCRCRSRRCAPTASNEDLLDEMATVRAQRA